MWDSVPFYPVVDNNTWGKREPSKTEYNFFHEMNTLISGSCVTKNNCFHGCIQ